MGPRSGDRGNNADYSDGAHARPLQWGRDLEIAEIRVDPVGTTPQPGFNGAAIWRSRKSAPPRPCELPPPCFNGAAIWRSRKCRSALFTPLMITGFNGAAIWRSRK